jgi:hypothetical protein
MKIRNIQKRKKCTETSQNELRKNHLKMKINPLNFENLMRIPLASQIKRKTTKILKILKESKIIGILSFIFGETNLK